MRAFASFEATVTIARIADGRMRNGIPYNTSSKQTGEHAAPGASRFARSQRVLVLCGDPWHPAEVVRRGLAALIEPRFEFEFVTDGGQWSPGMLTDCDLVIVAKSNQRHATDLNAWLTPNDQWEIRRFVQRGGGLFVIHGGTAGYEDLLLMRETTGGVLSRHRDQCPVTVQPVCRHALTEGVTAFTATDEHYFIVLDDLRAEVFLRTHSRHGMQPAGWTRREGAGRVCVLTPGHNDEVWLHPEFQRLLRNGMNWLTESDRC